MSSPLQGATKENADPNRQASTETVAKVQLISARLAEWKKRMGVVSPSAPSKTAPAPTPPLARPPSLGVSLPGAAEGPLVELPTRTPSSAREAQHVPPSPPRSLPAASPPTAPQTPPAPTSFETEEKEEKEKKEEEVKEEKEEKEDEERDEGERGETGAEDSLLVFDFGAPRKPAAPRFVPGRNSQKLLEARAEKKKREQEAARAQANQAPPQASSPPEPSKELSPVRAHEVTKGNEEQEEEEERSALGSNALTFGVATPSEHSNASGTAAEVKQDEDAIVGPSPEMDDPPMVIPPVVDGLAGAAEDDFDLDLSIDGTANLTRFATRTPSPAPLTDHDGAAQATEDWEKRYHEEHGKHVELRSLYERDLEVLLRQLELEEQEKVQAQYEVQELRVELLAVTESFADLKKRYDETKVINENLRKNEANLVATLQRVEEERADAEARFEALRTHAEEKLASAAAEVRQAVAQAQHARGAAEDALAEQTKQVAFWQARALLAEAKLPGLMQALTCKENENKELLLICDQLMASLAIEPAAHTDAAPPPGGDALEAAL